MAVYWAEFLGLDGNIETVEALRLLRRLNVTRMMRHASMQPRDLFQEAFLPSSSGNGRGVFSL